MVAAARRLVERVDDLTDRTFEEIRKIPEYAALDDPVIWGEIRGMTPNNIRLYYATVVEGRTPREEEMTAARYYARRRVEQGISLRTVRSAYARGVRILWGALVREVAGKPGLQRELLERSAWAFQHLDVFNSAVAEAYYEAQEGRSRHRDQLTRDLFDEIVDGDPSSPGALESRARLAGLDVDARLHAIVVQEPADLAGSPVWEGLPPASVVVACAEAARLSPDQIVAARRGRELLLVVPQTGEEEDLRAVTTALVGALATLGAESRAAHVGVSGLIVGTANLRKAWREAKRAVELGDTLDPGATVHFYDDHVLHDLLDSTPEQGHRLIAQTVGPLLALGEAGERLIDTLEGYFRAGLSLKLTAAALDIHRNTLTYRLRQIRRLTGLDLENPKTRLLVENALQVLLLERKREARPEKVVSPRSNDSRMKRQRTTRKKRVVRHS